MATINRSKGGVISGIHFQARLRANVIRESDAVNAYLAIQKKWNTDDREIAREALIALAEKIDGGFQPQAMVVGEGKVTAEMFSMMKRMAETLDAVALMDFSHARHADGRPVDASQMYQQIGEITQGASSIMSTAVWYDEDEEN